MNIDARVYYPNEKSPGILVEVLHNRVCEIGDDTWRPLKDYQYGRFVKLIEVQEPTVEANGSDKPA